MAASFAPWSRLIRFVSAEDGQVHYGQPIEGDVDVGKAMEDGKRVKAHKIVGEKLPFDGQVDTKTVLTVQKLLSPIDQHGCGGSLRLLGANYKVHVEEAGIPFPQEPIVMVTPRKSLGGPGNISVPAFVHKDKDQLDYEAELAVVIRKDVKNVKKENALDYVLGYTGANDVTARFHQKSQAQWNFAKGFDDFNPIGPVLVSNRCIADPQNIDFEGFLNGKSKQKSNTSDQIFGVAETIAFLSNGSTLEAGTIILMGTTSGIGYFSKPQSLIQNGDTFVVWHGDRIGSLINRFVFES
ncbi:fumarylacetoacetate hydrolase [Acaromyces ingoldii]|uniref:Fumarylacetoacetate hydrolase n=1 Tax=Acaromyces ingoldii TaxID=215250 RepID=A0A316YC04_9BASI|nr:fumarylacetoacetate hydrolase [Acaromyces ingoldii]PWN86761.1 fumarylacetoacetate hydrolase [Acaromyces ingoldii]